MFNWMPMIIVIITFITLMCIYISFRFFFWISDGAYWGLALWITSSILPFAIFLGFITK